METAHIPDFLTVAEAGRILRIGRTAAYEQAHLWLASGGREGLPVQRVGGVLRVPRALFEQHYGIQVTSIPPQRERRRPPSTTKKLKPVPKQDIPRSTTTTRRRRKGDAEQAGLPFAG